MMQNIYEVSFISKDGQTFTAIVTADVDMEAISLTEKKITAKGWDNFQYTFNRIKKLKG